MITLELTEKEAVIVHSVWNVGTDVVCGMPNLDVIVSAGQLVAGLSKEERLTLAAKMTKLAADISKETLEALHLERLDLVSFYQEGKKVPV